LKKSAFKVLDIIFAKVVLPVQGGHQKIIEGILLFFKNLFIIQSSPTRCFCHINQPKSVGLRIDEIGSNICFF
jgi:hypothetical protein